MYSASFRRLTLHPAEYLNLHPLTVRHFARDGEVLAFSEIPFHREAHTLNDRSTTTTIRVIGTKYDGSSRDEWPAQLIEQRGTQLRVHVPAGTEGIVRGHRRQVTEDSSTDLYWTDRWYNVWQFERTEGVLFYANVAMPCQFDGSTLRWVDLDIDIVCYANGPIVVKDEDEFEEHIVRFAYPEDIVEQALGARDELLCLARTGAFPFDLDKECRNGRL